MSYLTREEALAQLANADGDCFLFGDPDKGVPLHLICPSQKGNGWNPGVPANIVRALIEDGSIVRDKDAAPTGECRYWLAR